MTREEAIKVIRKMLAYTDLSDRANLTADMVDACRLAIKALEQEDILDKIRAEIKALSPKPTAFDVVDVNPIKDAVWETIADVLKIIDKYKAESGVDKENGNG